MSTSRTTNAPALIAYQVGQSKDGGKNYWRRIGAAWKNKKGGFQLRLESIPMNGELVLLPPREANGKGAA